MDFPVDAGIIVLFVVVLPHVSVGGFGYPKV